MIQDEYSPYKIVHHPEKISELKAGNQPTPLQVQIVPANACNQRCSFCAYRMKDYLSNQKFDEKVMMSREKLLELVEDLHSINVNAVQFTGGGEPLVHPDIKEVFGSCFEKEMDVSLVTNGMALDEELCKMLGDAAWVRVSMDSCTPEVYGFMRNVPQRKFQTTLDNLKMLVDNRRTSIIGVGFVVNKENYHEILESAKLYKSIGVNNFRISAAFTPMGYKYFDSFREEAQELAREAEKLSDGYFTVFNLFNDRVEDNFEGTQDYPNCPIKDLLAYVGADYNVYTCCTLAYNEKGLIGSIKDQSFVDLWMGARKQKMFEGHDPRLDCQHPCMYKGKNDFINYCIKTDPKHINYI